MSQQGRWSGFYKANDGRGVRPFFLRLMELYPEHVNGLQAVDLGCGDGEESYELAKRGWRVLAIDYQAEALDRLFAKVPSSLMPMVEMREISFENPSLTLPPADLVFASYSLPFCSPKRFPDLWERIRASVKPGGRFAGQLFGVNDAWAAGNQETMTFHTTETAKVLFDSWIIEYFDEFEGENPTATQGIKHWHKFDIIAQRGT